MDNMAGLAVLIRTCAKSGVKKLKFEGVEVEFGDATITFKDWPKTARKKFVTEDAGEPKTTLPTDDDQMQLLLEDPLEYEKRQLEG